MCERASMYLTKHDEFYLPREVPGSVPSESHTEIMAQHGLPVPMPPLPFGYGLAIPERGTPFFDEHVRGLSVECMPPDGDYSQPFYHWKLKVDQDIQPVWARDTSELLTRAHLGLPDWAKSRVMLGADILSLRSPRTGLAAYGVKEYWVGFNKHSEQYPFAITRESLPPPILKAFAHELALDGEHVPTLNADDLLQALEEHGCVKAPPPPQFRTPTEADIMMRTQALRAAASSRVVTMQPLQCGKTQTIKAQMTQEIMLDFLSPPPKQAYVVIPPPPYKIHPSDVGCAK